MKTVKNNKIIIVAPTWNNEFELPDDFGCISGIQHYNEFVIKKLETLIITPIHVYINRINNRLVFKIKR